MALTHYWQKHPPVHLLVAGFMGYKPQAEEKKYGDLGELIAMFPGGVISG